MAAHDCKQGTVFQEADTGRPVCMKVEDSPSHPFTRHVACIPPLWSGRGHVFTEYRAKHGISRGAAKHGQSLEHGELLFLHACFSFARGSNSVEAFDETCRYRH
ncbi:hypothetical protein LIA77_01297 [Sarocladium implicatum]|nr:hypothetical protein LIA77_01297 [Sarocladium implicatum]